MKTSRSGLSLPELLVCLGLFSLLIGFNLHYFSGQGFRASSQGITLSLAGELAAARSQAISRQWPVGFCLPTQAGTRPHSQSFYWLEGLTQPRRTRVVNYAREFPDSVLAVLGWGGWTLARPNLGDQVTATSAKTWLNGGIQDFVLIFTPEGRVTSNDWPMVNGYYHILVASSLQYNPASPSGGTMTVRPPYFSLSRVAAPQTVRISTSGAIEILSGVAGGNAVPVATAHFGLPTPPAPAVATTPTGNQDPVIVSLDLRPKPRLEPKARVAKSNSLSVKVKATDRDGQQLFVSWTSTPLGGGAPGGFSLPDQTPMTWSPPEGAWVSTVTWSPPDSAMPNSEYQLECTVTDTQGRAVSQVASALDPVTVVPDGKVLLQYHAPGPAEVAMVQEDGSRPVNLTDHPCHDYSAKFSPDGTHIAWSTDRDEGLNAYTEIYVMKSDGSGKTRVTNTLGKFESGLEWSFDGTRLIYTRNWPDYLWSCNRDGSGAHSISTGGYSSEYGPAISPNGKLLAYGAYKNAPPSGMVSTEIVVAEFVDDKINPTYLKDSTNLTNNAALQKNERNIRWHPTSTTGRIVWDYWHQPSQTVEMQTGRVIDLGAGNVPRFQLVDQVTVMANAQNPMFSADGRQIVFNWKYGISPQGTMIGDWTDDGVNPPTVTNIRKMTGYNFPIEYPTDWFR